MPSIQILSVVFAIVLLLVIFLVFQKGVFKRVYKPKGPYLLSAGEKRFFDTLVQSIGAEEYVCPKVRIADLVEVDLPKNDKEYWASFNKISQKHVDFVIVNRNDFAPKLIIELDGGSHNDKTRLERDEFVDSVLKSARIPIVHVEAKGSYLVENVKALIRL
jgi:hypothetical protein